MDKELPATGQIELFEKLATEFCKHEILKDKLFKKKRKRPVQSTVYKAYKDIAKNLGLADAETVQEELQNLKRYVDYKMRRYVRLSIINGVSVEDAFNYAPDWFKQLDKPLNLLQRACQVERMNSFKYYRAGRRMNNFLWELLQGARSVAVRELSNSAEQASRALTSKEAVREYAEAMDMDVNMMHGIWVRFYAQSVYKLMALIEVGDCSDSLTSRERITLQEWQAVDMGLFYDTRLHVVNTKYFKSSLTVCPMILLFKLMIVANEKINKKYSANAKSHTFHVGCQSEKSGARTGTEDLSESHNNKEANVTPSCSNITENIVPEVRPQSVNNQSKENNSVNKSKTDKKGPNEYETAEIWALVHTNYTNRGRSASAPLLQKRWHELKQQTRAQIWAPGQQTPVPILLAMAKRFPYILTEKLPTWSELVKNNQVFLDLDLESYKTEYPQAHLDIPTDMYEEMLFDELYDWSDDEIEIINENKETITVSDSDDEQTLKPDSNNEKDTDTSKLNVVDNNCIEQLERIDPTTAKIKIIFEDDSDSDINDYLNGDDNSNLHIVDFPESANDKNEKTPPFKKESDVNNSDNKGSTNECSKTRLPLNFQRTNDVNSDVKTEIKEESTVVSSEVQEEDRQSEIVKLVQNIKVETDDKFKYLYKSMPSIEPNLQCNDGLNNVPTECVGHLNDIKSEIDIKNDDITDINKSNTDIVHNYERFQSSCINGSDRFNDDIESSDLKIHEIKNNLSVEDPLSTPLVDEKLIKLSRVILTPIEHLWEWQCYSRDGVINCRRFSVRNFSKQVVVTSKQLAVCRRYIRPESSRNGISAHRNREFHKMPNDLKRKRKFLTDHLKLSRTYFSLEFWNERNIEQLELCKPLSIKLNRSTRVVKRIELADIDEVRRINKTILTAQVAPITVGTNDTVVNDPVPSEANSMSSNPLISGKDNSTNVNQISRTSFKCAVPNVYKIQNANQPESTSEVVPNSNDNQTNDSLVRSDNPLLISNLYENEFTKNSEFNYETDHLNIEDNKLRNEDEVKDLVKKIVRRGVLPKLSGRNCLVGTRSISIFTEKQKELEKDIRKMSEIFMQRYDRINKTKYSRPKYQKKKNKKKQYVEPPPLFINPNLNCLEEWQRQKVQNLQYFNFEPVTDKTKSNKTKTKNIKQHTNKNSKDTKDKESTKISDPNENETNKEIDDNKDIKFNADNLANVINNDSATIKCENIDISSENYNEKDNNNINNGLKRKSVDTSDILSKQSRIESNEDEKLINATKIEPDSVIDLCGDSDDNDDVKPPLTTNNPHSINQNTQNINESLNSTKPQINIKIVQNTIEINGQCTSDVSENQNKELLTFLSKVAGKIQEKNTAPSVPTPNPVSNNLYYVIKTFDKNIQNPITPEMGVNNINTSNISTNTVPIVPIVLNTSPLFYVVKIPDGISGATSVITPEQFALMPVIQNVSSLSQMHQQNFIQPNLPCLNQYNIPIVNALEKKSDAMPVTTVTPRPRQGGRKGKSKVTLSRMNDNTQICPMGVSSGSSHQISDKVINEKRWGNYGPNKGQAKKDMSSLFRKFGNFQNLQQTWNLSIEKNNITVTPNSSQDTSQNKQQNIISNYSYSRMKKSSKYINDSFS